MTLGTQRVPRAGYAARGSFRVHLPWVKDPFYAEVEKEVLNRFHHHGKHDPLELPVGGAKPDKLTGMITLA